MLKYSGVLIGFLIVSARADDTKLLPPSPVQTLLESLTKARERATSELVLAIDRLEAEKLPESEKVTREKANDDRWQSAVRPLMNDLLEAASSHPDDPSAVEGLGYVALHGRALSTDESRRAIVALLRDHVRASNISSATRTLFVHGGKPEATALLRAVIADNPNRSERGRACNDLAWLLQFWAGRIERIRDGSSPNPLPTDLEKADPTAMRAEAEVLYDRCAVEFADVPIVGYGAGKTVGDFARGALFDIRHLQVGQVAPEIAGQDIDGKPLRLGDHRGKVVVLVFSGEWCGPCRGTAMYFRDLLKPESQKINPCVVLEVNTDSAREPVRKAMSAGEIAWPCWFDGGVTGPITMTWGVSSFPTIYVLDPQGIIRAKDIRGEATAAAVAKILGANQP